ncbi:hypothetical protein SEUCBS139899_008107 [Sporothrix eucalyptigena]
MADANQAEDAAEPLPPPSPPPLMRLPNELLFDIADHLDLGSMARLMVSSRFLYQLLVDRLYRRDADARGTVQEGGGCLCCPSALRWGCRTSNVDTIRRAATASGVSLRISWPHVLAMALDSGTPSPVRTLKCLLEHGLPANVVSLSSPEDDRDGRLPTFWPHLAAILEAAVRPPRWCPLPVVTAFLDHGGTLSMANESPENQVHLETIASAEWDRVQDLVQVRGPRQWRWPHPTSSGPTLRHDHCLHDTVPCNVALTRLLFERGRADPNIVSMPPADGESLLMKRFLHDARRPVDLLRCLFDAGADLGSMVCHRGQSRLHTILEDAVRQRSFAASPRRPAWDCYPAALSYNKAEDIVRFFLSRGLPGVDLGGDDLANRRTLWLLDRWDPHWQRLYRRPGQQSSRKKRRKTQAQEGGRRKRKKVQVDTQEDTVKPPTATNLDVGPNYV